MLRIPKKRLAPRPAIFALVVALALPALLFADESCTLCLCLNSRSTDASKSIIKSSL